MPAQHEFVSQEERLLLESPKAPNTFLIVETSISNPTESFVNQLYEVSGPWDMEAHEAEFFSDTENQITKIIKSAAADGHGKEEIINFVNHYTYSRYNLLEWLNENPVPGQWVDHHKMIRDCQSAGNNQIALPLTLLFAGLTHPNPHVRETFLTYQAVSNEEEQKERTELARYSQYLGLDLYEHGVLSFERTHEMDAYIAETKVEHRKKLTENKDHTIYLKEREAIQEWLQKASGIVPSDWENIEIAVSKINTALRFRLQIPILMAELASLHPNDKIREAITLYNNERLKLGIYIEEVTGTSNDITFNDMQLTDWLNLPDTITIDQWKAERYRVLPQPDDGEDSLLP